MYDYTPDQERTADYRSTFIIIMKFKKLTPELIELIKIEKDKFIKAVKLLKEVGLISINTETNTYDSKIDIKRGLLISEQLTKTEKTYKDEKKRGHQLKKKKEKNPRYQLAFKYWNFWQEKPSLYKNESQYRKDMVIRFEDTEDKIDNHQDNLKKWIKGWKKDAEQARLQEESTTAFNIKLNEWKKAIEIQTQKEISKAFEEEYLKSKKNSSF